jgi:hypothetical protein
MMRSNWDPQCDRGSKKLFYNELIAAFANNHIDPHVPKHAIVLDDPGCLTTRTLLDRVPNVERIVIPQYDKTHYDGIVATLGLDSFKFGNVRTHLTSIGAYLDGLDAVDFNVAFFDYCSELTGSSARDEFPLRDLDAFLSKTKESEVVLAVTCSMSKRGHTKIVSELEIDHRLEKLIVHNGWIIENRWRAEQYISHKSPMVFAMFALCAMDYEPAEYGETDEAQVRTRKRKR